MNVIRFMDSAKNLKKLTEYILLISSIKKILYNNNFLSSEKVAHIKQKIFELESGIEVIDNEK